MIYSCFDERHGLYDYYEDDSRIPTNGDLPIPKPPSDAGRIGAPSRESGRPLPWSANKIGSGWHARGMVVNCNNNSMMSGFGQNGYSSPWNIIVPGLAVIGAGSMIYFLWQAYLKTAMEEW